MGRAVNLPAQISSLDRRAARRAARRVRFVAMTALAVLAAPGPTADDAASPACFESWWSSQLDEVERLREGPEALLPLRLVGHVQGTAADPNEIDRRLARVASSRGIHPLVRAEIEWSLLHRDLLHGELDNAAARRQRLGIVERFLVAGPGESTEPLEAEADGSGGPAAAWRALPVNPRGVLPLKALFHPSENTRATAAFYVHLRKARTVAVRFGADDRARLVVDGHRLPASYGDHELRFDQHAVFLDLSGGWHRVEIVVEQEDGDWAALARLTRPDGSALDDAVSVRLPDDRAAVDAEIASRRRGLSRANGDTLTAMLEKNVERGNAGAIAPLALDLAMRQIPDRSSGRPLDLIRQLGERGPHAFDAQWVSSLVEKDASRRRAALESILRISPDHPAALRRLAHHYLDHGNDEAALDLVRRARESCRGSDPYLDGWQAVLTYVPGAPGLAIARLLRVVDDVPQPALVDRLAGLLRAEGLSSTARALLDRHLEREPGDTGAREARLALAAAALDAARHTQLLEEAIELQPYAAGWRVRLASSLLADSQPVMAREALEPALRLSPDSPELLALLGEIRLASGDREGAEQAWRRAVAAGAGADRFDERLSALTGTVRTFGDEWAVGAADANARLDAHAELVADAPVVLLSRTDAIRVQPNGLAERFVQIFYKVRNPDQASIARSHSVTYSPRLQRVAVTKARLSRADGTELDAVQRDSPMLGDPELRLWYDSRIVSIGFPRLQKDDLIEIRYRITDRGPVNQIGDGYFGDVMTIGGFVPTLSSRIVIEAPEDRPVRHVVRHLPAGEKVRTEPREGGTVTIIDLPPLPAYSTSANAPPVTERVPYAVVGTVESWERLGTIYARLIRDQLRITQDIREVVLDHVRRFDDERALVDALYQWVIENTRYVALELGIHALKPYDVGTVFQRRHGDCKDKASLLVSMLGEAGIEASVTLLRTRDRGDIDTTVPTFAAFDHAIVHVPEHGLWLDGTVLHHASDELPLGDRNSLALVIENPSSDAARGRLSTTPGAAPDDDVLEREESIEPRRDGEIVFDVKVKARGERAAWERAHFRNSPSRAGQLAERLRNRTADLELTAATFDAVGLADREVRYGYSGSIPRFGRREGSRISLPIAIEPPSLPVAVPSTGREIPVWLPSPSRHRTVVTVRLPDRARVVQLPASSDLRSDWGRVRLSVRRQGRNVTLVAESEFLGGTVDVASLPEFASWIDETRQSLEQRIVLEWES